MKTCVWGQTQTSPNLVVTFALGAVVVPAEGLVFGDVGVQELEGILCHQPLRDHLVVPEDVGERQGYQAALGVRLHGGVV